MPKRKHPVQYQGRAIVKNKKSKISDNNKSVTITIENSSDEEIETANEEDIVFLKKVAGKNNNKKKNLVIEILSDEDEEIETKASSINSSEKSSPVTVFSMIGDGMPADEKTRTSFEKKSKFIELARANNSQALDSFISNNQEILFYDFIVHDGVLRYDESIDNGSLLIDIFKFALKQQYQTSIIELIFNRIEENLHKKDHQIAGNYLIHFDFYWSVKLIKLVDPKLRSLNTKILALYKDIDDGTASYPLLVQAIDQLDYQFIRSFLKLSLAKNAEPANLPAEQRDKLLLYILEKYQNANTSDQKRIKRHVEKVIDILRISYPKDRNVTHNLPLIFAIKNNLPLSFIKSLCMDRMVNFPDKDGFSPLMLAMQSTRSDKRQIIQLLLQKGANPSLVFQCTQNISSIQFAANIKESQSIVKLLDKYANYSSEEEKQEKEESEENERKILSPLLRHSLIAANFSHETKNEPVDIKELIEQISTLLVQKKSNVNNTLLLITLKCMLLELQRLHQWSSGGFIINQALVDSLSAIIQSIKEVSKDKLFDSLPEELKCKMALLVKQLFRDIDRIKQRISGPAQDSKISCQIPSNEDLLAMEFLCAGAEDSQMHRLAKMAKTIQEQQCSFQVHETDLVATHCRVDKLSWLVICQAIRQHQPALAEAAFKLIPQDNPLLAALLKAHSREYLLYLILKCSEIQADKSEEIEPDVNCGHLTFEVLIRDLIATLEQRQDINLSFGLPTHHAYRDQPAGFCLINKVAVIIAYEQLVLDKPFKAVILGLDVNRDDGLNNILMAEQYEHPITHIDIYDSRVYPWHSVRDIDKQLGSEGRHQRGQVTWKEKSKVYVSIDLASKCNLRKQSIYHPAILRSLDLLEKTLEESFQKEEKVIIFLPTGWDSHHQEKAPCGQCINNKYMLDEAESMQCRFTDEDLQYFNKQLLSLYQKYQSTVLHIYWQLEGGYTDAVNNQQIVNLIASLSEHLKPGPSQKIGYGL